MSWIARLRREWAEQKWAPIMALKLPAPNREETSHIFLLLLLLGLMS